MNKQLTVLTVIFTCHLFNFFSTASAKPLISTNEDLAPICSGNGTIRWISLSAYYETGQYLFVESTTNNQQQQQKCPTCAANLSIEFDTGLLYTPTSTSNYQTIAANKQISLAKLTASIASANARAPPFLSKIQIN